MVLAGIAGDMDFDCDYRAEAAAAMEMAATATNEAERLKWLRIALAWRDLEQDLQRSRPGVQLQTPGLAIGHPLRPGSPNQNQFYNNLKRSH
jgi:hypothetical protein